MEQPSADNPQEVRFKNGNDVLAGSIWTPAGAGPFAALVMVHGSGAADRDDFGLFPLIRTYLAERGIAVLCYDKPGVGGSSGDWRYQTFRDRAMEALAAQRCLAQVASIDAARVGLFGHSQGGWIVPLAASLSDSVPFIIMNSGPGITVAEQIAWDVQNTMRADNFVEAQVQEAQVFLQHMIAAARRNAPYPEVADGIVQAAREQAWFRYVDVPDAAAWSFLTASDPVTNVPNIDYDPLPVLARVACPVLAVFGEKDILVPVKRSIDLISAALRNGLQPQFKTEVFPNANHHLKMPDTSEFAPGYLELLAGWIARR